MGKIWAISTNKGGTLKTSITTNLAGVMATKGKKVLIIDTDNQGNAALAFGKNPDQFETTIYDVITGEADAYDAIVNVYENIDLAPANDDMAFFEFDVLTNPKKYPKPFSLIRNQFSTVAEKYDFVLIDTPPNIGLTTGNVLTFADRVLIPFQPESFSMRSLVKILQSIKEFRREHNPGLSVLGIVATLVDSRTTLHSETLQECRRFCDEIGIRMFETVIPRTVRFASSVAYEGLPATLTSKNNPLILSYFELEKEIMEKEIQNG